MTHVHRLEQRGKLFLHAPARLSQARLHDVEISDLTERVRDPFELRRQPRSPRLIDERRKGSEIASQTTRRHAHLMDPLLVTEANGKVVGDEAVGPGGE
jgi:hypothetical protein